MEEAHIAPGEAGVPASGRGGSQGVTCCRGLELAGVSPSMASPRDGRSWQWGCPSVSAHATWEDPINREFEPQSGAGSHCNPEEKKMRVWGSFQQFLQFSGWVKPVPFAEQDCCFSRWRSLCCPSAARPNPQSH